MAIRRDKAEIVADILSLCRNGANITRIVYRANLNFCIAQGYLKRLNDSGFIEILSNGDPVLYKTTPVGEELLRGLQRLQVHLRS